MHHFDGHHQSLTIKQSTIRKKSKRLHSEKVYSLFIYFSKHNLIIVEVKILFYLIWGFNLTKPYNIKTKEGLDQVFSVSEFVFSLF